MNRSIRENILFGKEYNKDFYDKCIEMCAFKKDIDSFDKKDLTGFIYINLLVKI